MFVKQLLQTLVNKIDYSNIGISIGNTCYNRDFCTDSKLLSKIIEIHTIHELKGNIPYPYEVIENQCQTSYPDMIIRNKTNEELIAVDIKSSYKINAKKFRGFTLGTYNGYFKNRKQIKNIMHPYEDFKQHLCICFIYNREENLKVEHTLVCEKWRIASKSKGSGNTCNIGSTKCIFALENSSEVPCTFVSNVEFDTYWMNK
jgi:hypothetical protein